MTNQRRDRAIPRPLIIAVTIGAAGLAGVPATTGSVAPLAMNGTLPAADPAAGGDLPGAVPAAADVESLIALALAAPALAWSTPAAPALTAILPVTDLAATSVLPPSTDPRTTFPLAAAPLATTPLATAPLAGSVPSRVPAGPAVTTTAKPGTAAAAAIEFALAQRGLPYVWGGDGPQAGDAGFDCSGLTTAAYAYAGITLPRTAHTQYYAGPHVPDGAALEPGDLVFYGVPSRVHHVGLYLGEGRMVNAPTFGKPVRLAYVRYNGDDYLGATRPAAGRDAPDLLESPELPFDVPPLPQPPALDAAPDPVEFPAPPVPEAAVPTPEPATAGTAPTETVPTETATEQTAPEQTVTGADVLPGVGEDPTATPEASPTTTGEPAGTADPSDATGTPDPTRTPDASAAGVAGSSPDTDAPDLSTPPVTTPPPDTSGPQGTTRAPAAVDAPAGTAPPETSIPPTPTPAPETPDATAEPVVPTGLALPGGTTLQLSRAERGGDGLPGEPSGSGTGTLSWRPGADGAWTAGVRLHPDTDTAGLVEGAPITVLGPDGVLTELTVRARRTLDPADADESAGRVTDAPRLVLVIPDGDTVRTIVAQ